MPEPSLEFIGMIQHRRQSEVHKPGPEVLDAGYIRDFARAHEAGGFDRILVGYYSDGPDTFGIAQYVTSVTERLGVLIAHRPGFVAPTLAARKLATLDQLSGGRVAVHMISGGDDADQARDGDFLSKDERYARTEEYIAILRRLWTADAPVDHDGTYYRFRGGAVAVRPLQRPHPPIYFGGASEAAIEVAGRQADTYMLWGETRAQVREQVARVGAAAARHGRNPRFSVSIRPILAPTEAAAWARAESLLERAKTIRGAAALGLGPDPQNEGSKRLLAAAAAGPRVDDRLWTAMAQLTGARGNTTALVGTAVQVAESIADYWELGVETFLFRGFDPLEDAVQYGAELLPAVREAVAGRAARRPAAA